MKKISGFTLVEMMIVLILIAIVAGIGIPNLTQMIRNNQMATHANSLLGALQLARSEAIRRGVPVAVCGSSNGSSCDQSAWGQGWIVYANTSGAGTDPSATGNEIVRISQSDSDITGTVSGGAGSVIRFAGNSTLHTSSARHIFLTRTECGAEGARRVTVVAGGRAAIEEEECP